MKLSSSPTPPDPDLPAYEAFDPARAASAAATERQLERETPGGRESAGHDPYAALRYRDCRLYLLGWLLNIIGTQIQFTAVGWDLYSRTGSALSLGWAGLVQGLPVILLSIPAGQLADRWNRRNLIVFSQVGAAASSIGLAALSYGHAGTGWIYAMLALAATSQSVGNPARSALLAATVPAEEFSNAATWNSSQIQVASVFGPALGGLLLHFGPTTAYMADACCSVACIAFLLSLRPRQAVDRREPVGLQSLVAGVRFVLDQKILIATITLDLFAVLLGGATYLLPVYAKDILHVGGTGFGWLRAAPAIGAFTMAISIAHLPPMKKAGRNLLLAVAGFGAATIVFGLSKNFWLSLAMLFVTGALDNISVVVRHTLVQVLTPDAMRGRVSAVSNVFVGASNELGGAESGFLAAIAGNVQSVVIGGVGTLLVVLGVTFVWPQVRRFGSLRDAVVLNAKEPERFPVAGG